MQFKHFIGRKTIAALALLGMAGLLTGCPPGYIPPIDDGGGGGGDPQAEYDEGFDVGFAEDGEYWNGFYDGYDTVDGGPIYYAGSSIPYVEEPPFDAGYYDGVWYAYNDGYFVDYDYAFTIGFSEGYDLAYGPDWPDLFDSDFHVEWLDGGFSDGYNDGFSEGRVFGAWDYENFWDFDWLGALLDYRDGTDLEIGGLGTGTLGPVLLYEYGTDPNDLVKSTSQERKPREGGTPAIRRNPAQKQQDVPALSYRALRSDVSQELNVRPEVSPRVKKPLALQSTWLERVDAYVNALGKANKRPSRAAE
jgi:hypothetical protein